ncbi:CPP1-like family protein [Pseudanabaena sp. PCC 6802]|uniref:CPP1-like family protein n=1 Tax=Pseudanabaena sp. PCC 6802 TaxID=118173 RepID=UPI0003483B0B|nr:CPP1-like family protein [Pseudanabaena sp. PCC 6802]
MSDPTPYEKLGIDEDASFEEVQRARDRMLSEFEDDELQQELIEAAYDAVLMDRLRARQEGKIKVPDRIRFPERLVANVPPVAQPGPTKSASTWLSRLVDNPSRQDVLVSLGVFAGLGVFNFLIPAASPTWLALSLLSSIYFLNRKENRFGRSVLLALMGLVLAVLCGVMLNQVRLMVAPGVPPSVATILMYIVMWLVTCFLR